MRNSRFFRTVFVTLLLFLTSCTKTPYPRSKAFYINDQASALLSSTEYYIYSYSRLLAETDSQTSAAKSMGINGTQVVVATYMGEPGALDTTTLFNEWGIGENDMGLLLMLYFAPDPDDEYIPIYRGMTREIGAKLANYISMFRLEEIFVDTWENPMFDTVHRLDYDYKLMYFYVHVLAEIYQEVYATSLNSERIIDNYEIDQYESFYSKVPRGNANPYIIKWWFYVVIVGGIVLLAATGGLSYLLASASGPGHRGGGGRSKGYRYTR